MATFTWANPVDNVSTTITESMTATTPGNGATLNIASSTNVPASGYALIDSEIIKYSSVGSNQITLAASGARGSGSPATTAATHSSGTTIKFSLIPSYFWTEIRDKFHETTGHKHTGVAGDAPTLGEVPSNSVLIWSQSVASIPAGYTEFTALRGRTCVGVPLGGTVAGSVLTALGDLASPSHTHTGPSHQHRTTIGDVGGTGFWTITGGNAPFGYSGTMSATVSAGSSGSQTVNNHLVSSDGTGNTGSTAAHLPYAQYAYMLRT